jgi:N-acetylglucosamine kinase-like BadF-type ATPase
VPLPDGTQDLVLGIDGGGTRTVALLATHDPSGNRVILGRGEAGPSNRHAVGAAAFTALDEATDRAFAAAGQARRQVHAACLGLAGAGRPGDQQLVRDWATSVRLAVAVDVVPDAVLLLAAGTPEGWGVAVVAGTGSMAFARDACGATARAGGWGPLLGDEGSGYAVALAGLRAAVRFADGRAEATILTECLLAALGLAKVEELIGFASRGGDRAAIAALAPVVLTAAWDGDRVAAAIVSEAATELATTADAATRQLNLGPALPIALAGGLLLESADYRRRFLTALAKLGLEADPITLVTDPAVGAVRLALHRLQSTSRTG